MPCWLIANPQLAMVRIGTSTPAAPPAAADWMIWVVTILLGIIGLALALRGIIGDRAKGRPHCRKCRYDMSGGDSLTCSECGHAHKDRKQLFKTRRYYKRSVFGSLLLMAALYCHTAPQVQFRRATMGEQWWESIVPTWAWIVMLPELEEQRIYFLNARLHPPDPASTRLPSTTLFSSSDPEEIDELEFEGSPIKVLTDLEARLLLSAARRRLETLAPASRLMIMSRHDIVIEWIYSVRRQVDVTPDLIWLLENIKNQHARVRAAYSLSETGRVDLAVPALIEALGDSEDDVQQIACLALAKLGPAGRSALPKLLEILDSADDFVSSHTIHLATRAVDAIGGVTATQLAHLIERKSGASDWALQSGIIWTELPNDDTSRDAARGLIKALNSDNTNVRKWAHNTFAAGGERMLPLLQWAVDQPDIPLDEGLSDHIQNLRSKAAPLSPGIVAKMLRDPDRYRLMLASILSPAGPHSRETLTLLVEALNHDDPIAREMAAGAIDIIAPKPQTMLPVLLERLKSKDPSHRVSAILQLAIVGPPAVKAVPVLRSLAREDESADVRQAAAALVKVFEP